MKGRVKVVRKVLIIVSILLGSLVQAYSIATEDSNRDSATTVSLHELKKQFSFNKEIPNDLEKEILVALSNYPELSKIKIKFAYKKIFTSMKATPRWDYFFRRKENREYQIIINSNTCHEKTIVQRISSDALTGVIGHELGHIVDYSKRSNWSLTKLLFNYIFIKGRQTTEAHADQLAIEHNLGKQLLEFTEFIFNDTCINPNYLKYKRKYYNTPQMLSTLVINWNGNRTL